MGCILVIDDDVAFRTALRESLVTAGYGVVEASEGQEGLQRCQEQRIDLAIVDLFMAGMEGFETMRGLRTLAPPVKIIAVSGGGEMGKSAFLSMAVHLGADRAFAKPLRFTDLLAAVQALLDTQ